MPKSTMKTEVRQKNRMLSATDLNGIFWVNIALDNILLSSRHLISTFFLIPQFKDLLCKSKLLPWYSKVILMDIETYIIQCRRKKEPAHNITYKKTCATSKDSICLHIFTVWSIFACMCILQPLDYPKRDKWEHWSEFFLLVKQVLLYVLSCVGWFIILNNPFCLFLLRFHGPVNPTGSCRARSVYLTKLLLDRLSPLRGLLLLCTFFHQKRTTALLESAEGNDHRKYFMINLHERMLPPQRGSNPQPPNHQSDAHSTEPPWLVGQPPLSAKIIALFKAHFAVKEVLILFLILH